MTEREFPYAHTGENENSEIALVVDDSAVEQLLISHTCENIGFRVSVASSATDALNTLSQENVHLIIADWDMPGMNGIELCKAVRALPLQHYVYFVITSSHDGTAFAKQAIEAGADQYIAKPIHRKELSLRLANAAKVVHLQRQLLFTSRTLTEKFKESRRDLNALAALQKSLLPRSDITQGRLTIKTLFMPSRLVSGDHMNVILLKQNEVFFYVIDVVGHGVASAVQAMALSRVLSKHPNEGILIERYKDGARVDRVRTPSEIAHLLNKRYQITEQSSIYFSMALGRLDLNTGRGALCLCGLPYPVWENAAGDIRYLGEPGFPVGVVENPAYSDIEFELAKGDRLFLTTDGLIELRNQVSQPLTLEDLAERLKSSAHQTLDQQINALHTLVLDWTYAKARRAELEDDISVLAMQWGARAFETHAESDTTGQEATQVGDWASLSNYGPMQPLPLYDDALGQRPHLHPMFFITDPLIDPWIAPSVQDVDWAVSDSLLPVDEAMQRDSSEVLTLVLDETTQAGVKAARTIAQWPTERRERVSVIRMLSTLNQALDSGRLDIFYEDYQLKALGADELERRIMAARRMNSAYNSLREKNRQLATISATIEGDLRQVFKAQTDNLPNPFTDIGAIRVNWLYQPARFVSGDFFNAMYLGKDMMAFYCLDAEGAGLMAAVRAWMAAQLLSPAVQDCLIFDATEAGDKRLRKPNEVLLEINRRTCSTFQVNRTYSLAYGLLNVKTGSGVLSMAGHPDATIVRAHTGHMERVGSQSELLGVNPDALFHNVSFYLAEGDTMYLFSDGLTDLLDRDGNRLGHKGARALVKESFDSDIESMGETLLELCQEQQGRKDKALRIDDDLSILVMQFGTVHPILHRTMNVGELIQLELHGNPNASGQREVPLAGVIMQAQPTLSNAFSLGKRTGEFTALYGAPDEVRHQCSLAVVEVCSNLVRHGQLPAGKPNIDIEALAFESGFVIRIIDHGNPIPAVCFDKARDMHFENENDSIERALEGGMGIALVFQLMDDIHYGQENDANVFYLYKSRVTH